MACARSRSTKECGRIVCCCCCRQNRLLYTRKYWARDSSLKLPRKSNFCARSELTRGCLWLALHVSSQRRVGARERPVWRAANVTRPPPTSHRQPNIHPSTQCINNRSYQTQERPNKQERFATMSVSKLGWPCRSRANFRTVRRSFQPERDRRSA